MMTLVFSRLLTVVTEYNFYFTLKFKKFKKKTFGQRLITSLSFGNMVNQWGDSLWGWAFFVITQPYFVI